MRRAVVLAVVWGALAGAPTAPAGIPQAFTTSSSPLTCTVQGGLSAGQRWCGNEANTTVRSWDGTPIDVSVGFPAAPPSGPDGAYPLIGIYHGWGGSKVTAGGATRFLNKGYAVFSITDRGWGSSCGGSNGSSPAKAAPCTNGYIHLMHNAYEVRDAQYLMGLLADEGLIDPQRIGATGGSYGGGISMQLGALMDRTQLPDGSLVPWTSPVGHVPMRIAATAPQYGWSNLATALMPNGSGLDYVARAPYLGAQGERRVGVEKQNWDESLNNAGVANGYYAPTSGTGFPDPAADITGWFSIIVTGGPYDTVPGAQSMIGELTANHSATGIDDTVAPAPALISSGWNDDLFPVDEGVQYYNQVRDRHPGTPISLFALDFGHSPRASSLFTETSRLTAAEDAWFDHYVKGTGAEPAGAHGGVTAITTGCSGASRAPGTVLTATSWSALSPGEIRLDGGAPQTITGPGTAPSAAFTSGNACATTASVTNASAATYTTDPAPTGGFTLAGAATVIADLDVTGANDMVALRLYDVDPGASTQRLIARGVTRPLGVGAGPTRQVFQLHPQAYTVDAGHRVKLELLGKDSTYLRTPSAAAPQESVGVRNLQLRIPVAETPGAGGGVVQAPAARVLPPGYSLSRDEAPPPATTIDGEPPAQTGLTTAGFTFSSQRAGSTFTCRVDGAEWAPCTSPVSLSALAEGPHTFTVRGADANGNVVEEHPPSRTFTVDTVTPDTAVNTGPSGLLGSSGASFTFSSDDGTATFECRLDGGAWASCSSPKALTGMADGPHTFAVRASDPAGNTDPSPDERTFTVDTTPTAAVIQSGPSGPVASTTAAFTFASAEAGSTFACRMDGAPFAACTSPKTFAGLPAGSHTFQVRATDPAGNTQATASSRAFTVDVAAPDTTITQAPGSRTRLTTATFAFASSEPSSTFTCRVDGAVTWSACVSPVVLNDLTAGVHSFQVRATDAAGNTDASPAGQSFTVDLVAPVTTILTGPAAQLAARTATLTFAADDMDASFMCRLDGGSWTACASPAVFAALPDGPHTVAVRAGDIAGNVEEPPVTRSFTVDATTPHTTIDSGPAGPNASASAVFAFSADEAGTFECRLDAGAWAPCASPRALSGLSEGDHTFTVRALDAFGNVDGAPAARAFTVDTVAPDTTIPTGPAGLVTSSTSTFTLGVSEPGASLACSFDDGPWAPCTSPVVRLDADGPHTFRARATDAAGNVDPVPASRTYAVDTIAPIATVLDGPVGAVASTTATFAISTDEPGATTACRLDAGAWAPCAGAATYALLADGAHTFAVRATDAAGNQQPSPATRSFAVDTTAPTAAILSAPTGVTGPEVRLAFGADDAVAFRCRLDDGPWAPCASPAAYAGLREGVHTFAVRAQDAVGNEEAGGAVRSFTVHVPNTFSLTTPKASPGGKVTVTVTTPGAGAVAADLSAVDVTRRKADRRRVTVATTSAPATGAGRRALTLRLTSTGRRMAARNRGRLAVRLTVRFTPAGGVAAARTVSLTARR